jgi:hypothetical protein
MDDLIWGARIAALIIDTEMLLVGYVRLNKDTSKRIAAYLEEENLRERFMADAEKLFGEPPKDLGDAFISLLPDDYEIKLCVEGITARPCPRWYPAYS